MLTALLIINLKLAEVGTVNKSSATPGIIKSLSPFLNYLFHEEFSLEINIHQDDCHIEPPVHFALVSWPSFLSSSRCYPMCFHQCSLYYRTPSIGYQSYPSIVPIL